jgi:hypothetical protein
MQIGRFFSSTLLAVVASLILAACLTFSPSPYDTAGGFSTASVGSPVSNMASKGDRLTSRHPNASARTAARPERLTAKQSGKIPVGCEAAVSRLVHSADFGARRCVT